jgi:excisionase family DNA binding protein
MKLSANEAAKRTGKSVPTITRAIKSGKISAEKSGSGGYLIDPAELFRVFPAVAKLNAETLPMLKPETPRLPPSETHPLQEKVASLEAALADAKAERDEWRDQAKRLAMALPAPTSETIVMPRQGMWARLFARAKKD